MSAQRFIRCPHCGLPHEAELTVCPVQGKALSAPKPRRRPAPPPSEEDYSWAHSLAPWSRGEGERDLDPSSLHTFIGKIVEGKYRIEALIGRGGMGAVFRARNTRIDKAVALKVLYRGYDKGSESERRFLREARIAGNLGHPNIVEVFDLGHLDEGMPFQVMELLEGQSLAQRVHHEGPLTESDALDIADQVLGALEAAHERGIIHRDLKPENVFLTERRGETTAKLLDFGVSKSLTEQTMSMTMTGVVVGTPYYLSPEQARGDREYDHRIDIWAMGVLLYESLTGVLPFNADSYEKLLVKILKQRPVAPSRFQPRISPSVEEVILRALSPDAADRPASAQIMLEDLRDARRAARDAFRAFGSDTMSDPPRFPSADATIKTRAVSVSAMPGPEDPTEVSDSFVSDDLRVVLERGKKEPLKRDHPDVIELGALDPLPAPAADVVEALAPLVTPARLARMNAVIARRTRSLVPVLEDLADPHNGAAVMRSADAFGCHEVHVVEDRHPFAVSHRVTRGTHRWLDLVKHRDIGACLGHLKTRGYRVYIAAMDGDVRPEQIADVERAAIVFGNEHKGVSDAVREAADGTYAIPMEGFVESLNVSVASAITLYVASRGRHGDLDEAAQMEIRARFLLHQVRDAERVVRDARGKTRAG